MSPAGCSYCCCCALGWGSVQTACQCLAGGQTEGGGEEAAACCVTGSIQSASAVDEAAAGVHAAQQKLRRGGDMCGHGKFCLCTARTLVPLPLVWIPRFAAARALSRPISPAVRLNRTFRIIVMLFNNCIGACMSDADVLPLTMEFGQCGMERWTSFG
eukprot:113945-Chlamydomonas_euryale.AAC.4